MVAIVIALFAGVVGKLVAVHQRLYNIIASPATNSDNNNVYHVN